MSGFILRGLLFVMLLTWPSFSQAAPRDSAGMMMIILQDNTSLPTADEMAQLLKSSPFGASRAIAAQGENLISIDQASLVALMMNAPVPQDDLTGPCEFAKIYWKDSCAFVKKHKSHIILHLHAPSLSAVERAQWLTQIAAVLMRRPQAGESASLWGEALSSQATFLKAADSLPTMPRPTYIWVSFNFEQGDDDSLTLTTSGMEQFGLMQIEINSHTKKLSELWALAGNVASYLMDQGPVLKDGDTLGYSATEQIKVRHEPSLYRDTKEKVYRLYVDNTAPESSAAGEAQHSNSNNKTTEPSEAEPAFPPEEP